VGRVAVWLDGRRASSLLASETADRTMVASSQPEKARGPRDNHPNKVISKILSYNEGVPMAACYLSYFGLAFFVLRWWKLADRRRPQRFSLFSVLAAGFWGYLLLLLWPPPSPPVGFVALVMASVIIQLVSPWEAPPPRRSRRPRTTRS